MNHRSRAAALSAALCIALGSLAGCSEADPALPVSLPQAAVGQVPADGPAPTYVGRPTRVLIPALRVDEALTAVGLQPDGALQMPDFGAAGWYDLGPRPGARGPAVIVAHVHGPSGDDVFAQLRHLRPGDRVTVRRTDGESTFVVDRVEQTRKEALPVRRIWNDTAAAVLRLITCAGEPDPVTRAYPDNTVVYASLAS